MSKNKTKSSKIQEEEDFSLELGNSEDESKNSKASDSEEDVKLASKKKATKKKVADEEEDDDDDIAVKKTKKGSKKKDDDDGEDSGEPVVSKKKKKTETEKKPAKKTKKTDSEDEEESEQETKKKKKSSDKDSDESPKKTSVETSSYQRKKATRPIYRYNEIKFENLVPKPFNFDMNSAWINYTDDNLKAETTPLIQSGYIILMGGGTPKLDLERKNSYYPTDEKREFTRVPLDPEQKECVRLRKFLEEADSHFDTVEFRKAVFGDQHAKYTYVSLISPAWDGGDDKKTTYPKHDRIKLKFASMFANKAGEKCKKEDANSRKIITVKMLRRKDKKKDGEMTHVKATTVPQIANEIKPGTETRFVFTFQRVYVNPQSIPNPDAKKDKNAPKTLHPYGVHLKVLAFEYIPRAGVSLSPDDVDFVSCEEEDDDESQNEGKKETTTKSKKTKASGDDDEDDDDDEEQEVAPVKKGKAKAAKKSVVDSDESEEVKPKKKGTAKSRNRDE